MLIVEASRTAENLTSILLKLLLFHFKYAYFLFPDGMSDIVHKQYIYVTQHMLQSKIYINTLHSVYRLEILLE